MWTVGNRMASANPKRALEYLLEIFSVIREEHAKPGNSEVVLNQVERDIKNAFEGIR
jgi:hypothetical protein